MVVTEEYLLAHSTEKIGWTADQLRSIGISWPPKKGWKKEVIGTEITETQRVRFEQRLTAKQVGQSKTFGLKF